MAMTTTTTDAAVTPKPTSGASKLAEYARLKQRRKLRERLIETVLLLAACVSVFTTLGIVYILLKESVVFFSHVPVWTFLTDRQWTPLFDDAHFGIMVLLSGTISSSMVALSIAIPLGTIIAIYLSEFAGHKTRETMKPLLELLSGVPTIIFMLDNTSNWSRASVWPSGSQGQAEVKAIKGVVENLEKNVNIGLMQFSNNTNNG